MTSGWCIIRVLIGDTLIQKSLSRQSAEGGLPADIDDLLHTAVETKASTYAGTGDPATVYYRADGHYVVRNDVTGDVFHVSDTADPNWYDPFNEVVRPRP